jgi:DNA (cytosine-5)-methyltransferase 1
LRLKGRPEYESGSESVRIVDLFCGCGGLTLGLAEAACRLGRAIEIPLAVDNHADALAVFEANFPSATTELKRVEELFDGRLGASLTTPEKELKDRAGRVDILAGGPPCQGHSDLNNHTRRRDPRNALYDRMARAAEVLRPSAVLIENVPAVVSASRPSRRPRISLPSISADWATLRICASSSCFGTKASCRSGTW